MNHNKFTNVAAACLSVTLGFAMAGCGGSSDSDSSGSKDTKTTKPDSGGGGGTSSVVVDGKKWAGTFTTTCAKQGDLLALAIADSSGDATKGAGASIKGDNTVQAVAVGDASKGGAGYAPGTPGAKASVTKDGKTYTLTGVAVSVNAADPTKPKNVDFKIVFACDTIAGG